MHDVTVLLFSPRPLFCLRPSFFFDLLVVIHTQGHIAGSSPPLMGTRI